MIIIILIIAALIVGAMFWLAGFVMTGKRQTQKEAMTWQSEHYDTTYYDPLEKEEYTVEGNEGYILHVEFLKNPESSDKYIILSHGYTDTRYGTLKYVKMYLDLGYNCIIYDLRGHGDNESTFTTYGILESKDLMKLIEDTRNRYENLRVLGLHGESLGAASTITALQYKPDVDFVVADCGFADIEGVLKLGYQNAGVPVFLVDMADIGARLRYGYALKDMRPIDALKENTIPILFLHGEDDAFIIPENSYRMYDVTKGIKDIHTIPEAGHAFSAIVNPELYHQYVEDFLTKLGV